MSGDAQRIHGVGFRESGADAGVLSDVAVGVAHVDRRAERAFRMAQHFPPHDVHRGGIAESSEVAFEIELDFAGVVCVVARLAERDEVVGAVASGLAALDVVDVEHRVLRLAVAALALVPVTPQDVFAEVQEIELRPLLVFRPGDVGIFDALHVELRDLDDDLRYRKELCDVFDEFDVR